MKLFVYIICYLIYPFSFLFPRNSRKYVFGSYRGSFTDNSKYLFLYASENGDKDIDYIWLSPNKDTVRNLRQKGLRAYWIFGLRGIWHALTSKYWFFNSYTSDIMFCLSGRAVCINLWHGVGIKRIEFNSVSGVMGDRFQKRNKYDAFCHPHSFRKPDWVLSSTPFQNNFFSTSFRIPESRCLEMGYPRDWIITASEEERSRFISRYEPQQTLKLIEKLKQYDKVLIYMPTWRDSQRTIFTQSMDLDRLNKILSARNQFLILKPHANTITTELSGALSNIMLVDPGFDIYPILPYTQVLITDYSSIIYDWLLMDDKNVILYLYDYDDYVKERDFYYPYDENVVGTRVQSFESLCQLLESGDYILPIADRNRIVDKFWGKTTLYDSSKRILDFVKGQG